VNISLALSNVGKLIFVDRLCVDVEQIQIIIDEAILARLERIRIRDVRSAIFDRRRVSFHALTFRAALPYVLNIVVFVRRNLLRGVPSVVCLLDDRVTRKNVIVAPS